MPPRTTLKFVLLKAAVNDEGDATGLVSEPTTRIDSPPPRLVNRYSPFALMLFDNAYSSPPPAVQPVAVRDELPKKAVGPAHAVETKLSGGGINSLLGVERDIFTDAAERDTRAFSCGQAAMSALGH
jgi:hypothetical protein